MKRFLALFFFAASLHAQTLVNVQKTGAPANAISGDLAFPSGRTLTMSTGSHLVLASGTFSPAAGSIAWAALTGQPTTLAGYGITDPIVLTSGSYADPAWITSLASSKLTGTVSALRMPAFSGDATSSAGATVLTLAASGVTLGTYGSATQIPVITFDAKGRATVASLVTATPLFSSIASTPTSAAGYGIVNGANVDAWGAKTIPAGTIADLSTAQTFSNKALSGASNTFTLLPASALNGPILAANFPALTGDVTTTAGSLATSYAAVVPAAKGGAGAVSGILKANGSGVVSAAVSGTDYAPAGSYLTALTGDVTASGPGSAAATVVRVNGVSLAGLATGILKNTTTTGAPSIAVAGTDYQTPLTFSTGLTNTSGTVTVNTSQNVAKLSNLTTNGFVKTSGGDGTLGIDTATYLTGNQTITLSGDASGSGATSIAVTNTKLNGVSLAGLATGLLKNTTATGVPSIAAAGTDYVAPAGAGSVSGLTANGAVYAASANTLGSTAALTNGQILIGSTSAAPVKNAISGTANELTVTNGAGTITLSLPTALTFTGKTVTGGVFAATSFDGPVGSVTPASGAFTSLSSSSGTINGSIGATTPNTGAFSTLTTSAQATMGGLTTITANTSANAVFLLGRVSDSTAQIQFKNNANSAITSLIGTDGSGNFYIGTGASATNALSIDGASQAVAIRGTRTNNDGAVGYVGELGISTISAGSAVSVSNATTTNITSISLTAGDWDVAAVGKFALTGATTTDFEVGVSTTSATIPGDDAYVQKPILLTTATAVYADTSPLVRLSLATTTTVYLVERASFSAGTVNGYGTIRARRVR